MLLRGDFDVCGQAGRQTFAGSIEKNFCFVILSAVLFVGLSQGVSFEQRRRKPGRGRPAYESSGFLSDFHFGNVGFLNAGVDEHLRKVCHLEDHGTGVVHGAGDDELAGFGVDAGNRTVDRRENGGIAQILTSTRDLRLGGFALVLLDDQIGLLGFHIPPRGIELRMNLIHFGLCRINL